MIKLYLAVFALLLLQTPLAAQPAADYAVQLGASTQVSPPRITLSWKRITGSTGYTVSRKGKTETAWTSLATLTAADSTYIDASVIADSAYEYKVSKTAGAVTSTGYIYAGVRAPAIHHRGTLILMVDATFSDSCRTEIAQLMGDLRGDGWAIVRHDIPRTVPVTTVKSLVVADHAAHPDARALLLLGHIPVPYSGDINPDAHPDHLGAWPTDAYYADVDGTWTDSTVNNTVASRSQNDNIPGDGKWDQSFLPSEAELEVGRIDFSNMPAIKRSEFALMRAYLAKAHTYKMDLLPVIRKGLVDDNFGGFSGEAFAANAWRLFPVMIGRENVVAADYVTRLKDSAYQWAYACGGGSYSAGSGIGVTGNFDTSAVKGIFSMMFGSYFGDFDAQNNFLRAPLCAPDPALTSSWAGRPNWFLHHMALGENIGYGTRITQNNNIALYAPTNYGAYWVHVALMGDPSLRADYIRQPGSLAISPVAGAGAQISWTASPDPGVIGYYVYRSDAAWGRYERISGLLTSNAFTDASGVNGKKYYMLRPVKLQQTPSGGYYNLGVGLVDSAAVSYPLGVAQTTQKQEVAVFPNPATDRLQIMIGTRAGGLATLVIMNATGSVITTEQMDLHAGQTTLVRNISDWPAGLYTVTIRTTEGTVTRKWIKAE